MCHLSSQVGSPTTPTVRGRPHLEAPNTEELRQAVIPLLEEFVAGLPSTRLNRDYLDVVTLTLLGTLRERGHLESLSYHYDFSADTLTVKGVSAKYPISNELTFTVKAELEVEPYEPQ